MIPIENGSVTTPVGFSASGIVAGIKASGKPDMALIVSDRPTRCAAAFTQNAFAAPPVVYCRELLTRSHTARAVITNSGNANACTGRQGMHDAVDMASHTAAQLNLEADDVLVCSTGRIGVPMPMATIRAGIELAAAALTPDGGIDASRAIMTTDSIPKVLAVAVEIGEHTVHIGGMAKGAGMIAPNMKPVAPHATMLAYLTTDAVLADGFLETCLAESLDQSFNRVTVDGDTSTNDTFIALANGAAGNGAIRPGTLEAERFQAAFNHVAGHLARLMVTDGEGATKFVEIRVGGAQTRAQAKTCAFAIANSLLCKTAWFGGDPNWGRILDAAGYAGVTIQTEAVSLDYDTTPVVRNGMDAGTPEADLEAILAKPEFRLDLELGAGSHEYTAWTCDIGYEYVKINADYRT